ncbi:MAG: hypothetical protein V4582_13770 [Pseudomonadota bacterium]
MAYYTELQKLYVAYFNRPADFGGLAFWNAYVTAHHGDTSAVSADFSSSAEFHAAYAGLNMEQTIDKIYTNLFGHGADLAGKGFWLARLGAGDITLSNAVQYISAGAQGSDKVAFDSKVAAAAAFTDALNSPEATQAYSGATALQLAYNYITGVTDEATLQSALAGLAGTIDTMEHPADTTTYTLTNHYDIATAHTFNAPLVYTPEGNTRLNSLQNEDRLTGTSAADDVLNLTFGNSNENVNTGSEQTIVPTISGVEIVNIQFSTNLTATMDFQDVSGVNQINASRIASSVNMINMTGLAVMNASVKSTAVDANVAFTFKNGSLAGNQTVNLALDDSQIGTLVVASNAGNGSVSQQVETLNIAVASESHINTLTYGFDNLAATNQTLNIAAAARFQIGTLLDGADADSFIDLAGNGDGLTNLGGIGTINVTGAGHVILDAVDAPAAGGFVLNASTATGGTEVNISNSAADATASFTTGSGIDYIFSNQNVGGHVTTGAGDDTMTVRGLIAATATQGGASAVVDMGAGNDTLTVGTVATLNGVTGTLTGSIAGSVLGGATVNMGAGDDRVNLGDNGNVSIGEEGVLNLGEGNNTVTLSGSITGDTVAVATDTDSLGGEINGGAGNDTVTFNLRGQGNQGTLIGGLVQLGAGTNSITVTGNANANVVTFDPTDADRVSGAQTLNLISSQSWSAALATTVNGVGGTQVTQNDDNALTADYVVDASEFTGLATINMDNQAALFSAFPDETAPRRFAGEDASYTLNNLAGTEALNLTTVEGATGVQARATGTVTTTQIGADVTADATVNMNLDLAAAGNAVAMTIAGAGDVAINDTGVWTAVPAAGDTNKEIKDLTLTINGADSRSVIFAANDFRHGLTVHGDTTGTITMTNVEATVLTSDIAGAVRATLLTSEAKTITTGAGNDVINMLADTVNISDTINLGAGTNRIIVDDDLRGNNGADSDENFTHWSNVQEIELRGTAAATQFTAGAAGVLEVTLDDNAQTTGVNRVLLVDGVGPVHANVDMVIGADFNNALRIDMARSSTLTMDNAGGDVNLTLNLTTNTTTAPTGDTTVNFTNAGTGTVALNITTDHVAQVISAANTGATNDVILTNADAANEHAEIDSITLLDSNTTLDDTTGGAEQSGTITLTLGATWAQASDTLTVNASDINDDDDASFVNDNDTQDVVINGAAANYKLNITGSEVNDTITGSNLADTIKGGSGDDVITGGLGSDVLTGGDGVDTFIYTAIAQSNGTASATDNITDFVSGDDHVRITLNTAAATNIVSAGTFSNVTSSGDGDGSLAGTNGNKVAGDGFYDAGTGKLVIDVDGDGDITTGGDLSITSAGAVHAADIDFIINTTADGLNDEVVRGGQGADTITASTDDDVIVMVGSLSASDVDAYVTAGSAAAVGIDADIDKVLKYSELTVTDATSGRSSEIVAGETLDGGAGNDILHVFGTANLTNINDGGALNVETLGIHSTVTMTLVQLQTLGAVVLIGDEPHNIVITNNDGSAMTAANQQAALIAATIFVVGNGAHTTISIAGGTAMSVAAFVTAGYVNVASTLTVAQALVASPWVPYNLGDTAAALAAAPAGILNAAVNITANTAATVAQATTIEAATNTGVNAYTIADTATNLAASSNAVLTLATTVTASTLATGAQATTIAAFAKAVVYSVSDTAAAVAASTGLNEAVNITSTTAVTVAQATTIDNATNTGANTYDIADTALILTAAGNTLLATAGTVTATTAATALQSVTIAGYAKAVVYNVTDSAAALVASIALSAAGLNEAVDITATTAATVAEATAIEGATNTGVDTYNITDSAANLIAAGNAVLALAGTVTANAVVTAANADALAAFAKAVVYSVTDTATNLAGATAAGLDEAVNIVATTAATVAEATTIDNAANSGTNTYAITDSAANLAAAGNAILATGGVVTANSLATAAEATAIAAYAKAVVYSVSDTIGNLVAAAGAGLNEAVNLTSTSAATVAQATTIEAATNTGTNTYDITDTATNIAASSNAVVALGGTITATGQATGAEATTIAAFAKAVVYSITDTATAVAASTGLNEAVDITANTAATVAQATTIEAATNTGTNTYAIGDTATALAASSNAVLALGTSVTANTAATAAQAGTISAFATTVVYSVTDTATALAAAAGAALNEAVNLVASSAATVAQATTIEAATNTGTNTYAITDSAANLAAAGNAVLALATSDTANTLATAAEATTIAGFATTVVYSISDTGAAVAASTGLDEAVNITVTGGATVAEATTIEAAVNTGTNTYAIADTATNLAASTNVVLALGSTVTASTGATVAEGATIAAFAKAVVFAIDDTNANLTTLFNAGVTGAGTAIGEATGFTSNATVTLTTVGMQTLSAATGNLDAATAVIVDNTNAAENIGTLAAFGGSHIITFGDAAGSDAFTVNLGTSGVTSIILEGTGNHDITGSAATLEHFQLNAAYNGGVLLRGLTSGDTVDIDGANDNTAFTVNEVSAAAVDAAGEWFFTNGVLTYYDDTAAAAISIALVGVVNVLCDNLDTFTVV